MTTFPTFPNSDEVQKPELINQTDFDLPVEQPLLLEVLQLFEERYQIHFQTVELVYVDENEIARINHEHFQKSYVTDIITLQYHEKGSVDIEGTLFCCAPRIKEQSEEFGTDIRQEFYRVYIHGLLHLCGFDDQSPEQKREMSALEDHFLGEINV